MEDFEIVDLYWERDENAINQTDRKYGKYCRKIAYGILYNREDSDECVYDTYLQAWNSIPPQRPMRLSTYLGKICRNLSINLYEKMSALKRGGSETTVCLDELDEVVGSRPDADENAELSELTDSIKGFLSETDEKSRRLFLQRYWYMMSVKEIARDNGLRESNVKVTLHRTREKLKEYLTGEGYII